MKIRRSSTKSLTEEQSPSLNKLGLGDIKYSGALVASYLWRGETKFKSAGPSLGFPCLLDQTSGVVWCEKILAQAATELGFRIGRTKASERVGGIH